MRTMNRRTFLKSTALSTAAFSLPAYSWASVRGANETIRVAIVGFGGRGQDHISGMRGLAGKNVRVVALCDVDSKILDAGVESFSKRNEKVEGYRDIRKLLENKEVDAITIATPNHWHSLATIWAVQAGKDVYVEKPVSHNVREGRKIVEAARKYGRIVQTGTQSRSSFAIKEAIEWVHAGNLGKIKIARGLCYKRRPSIGKVDAPQPPPPEVDYDLWCGPAPMAPLRRQRLHYDWHWVWDTGCGDLGNQGIHQMDIARWFLGEDGLSPRVFSVGGRLGYVDDGETPNTQFVFHDYDKALLIFEVRGLPDKTGSKEMDKYPSSQKDRGGSVAVIVHCEGGHVLVPNYSGAIALDKQGKEIRKWSGADNHYEDFIGAVRSRKHTDLNADILEGHLSSALCHTGNVSYRLGHQSGPDEIREKIKADKEALETFGRMAEHLAANDVDLTKTKATLGAVLKMDPKQEQFIGNAEANKLLTREYRKPFVVPEKV
ncbi:MAG: dehydrogenase [Verrucomicrobia bacterium]|nr:MAG: dehydrogenase [Verrucomicrobiota bacterium]